MRSLVRLIVANARLQDAYNASTRNIHPHFR